MSTAGRVVLLLSGLSVAGCVMGPGTGTTGSTPNALTTAYGDPLEGLLHLSVNGAYLTLAGYNAPSLPSPARGEGREGAWTKSPQTI